MNQSRAWRNVFDVVAVFVATLVVLAPLVGCREDKPIPTTSRDVSRTMMEPNSPEKVRKLIELAMQSRADLDLPSMRTTLGSAMQSASGLEDPIVRAQLLTAIAAQCVKEKWDREAQQGVAGARIAAATIPELSKKVAAQTDLAVTLREAGDGQSADEVIRDAERTVVGVMEPELRVPLLVSLSAAFAKFGDVPQAEKHLNSAIALAATITDPVKRTYAESHAAAACFRGNRIAEGQTFYDTSVAEAAKISDPAVRTRELLDLVVLLQPYRKHVAVEVPLEAAIKAAGTVTNETEKQALLKRIAELPKGAVQETAPAKP